MKTSFSFLFVIVINLDAQAQSPVGEWKFSSYYTENQAGKKVDILKGFTEDYPCMTTVVLNFTADGKITVQDDQCRGTLRESGIGTKWKILVKNRITVLMDDPDIDPVTYNFVMIGNKMRWTMDFSDDSDKDKPDGVSLLVVEYIKA